MGFGTLFIGYFLLLNFTYFGFTDIVAAGIMAAGLYKLSGINREFKLAFYAALTFLLYSVPELIIFTLRILEIYYDSTLTGYISIGSSVIVTALTALIMKGILSVSREVGLDRIPSLSKFSTYACFFVYGLWIICNATFLTNIFGGYVKVIYLISIVLLLLYVGFNLYVIYGAYMKICMPGDEDGTNRLNKKRRRK